MKQLLKIQKRQEALSLVTNIAFTNVPCWYNATRKDLHMDLIIPKNRQDHAPCPVIVWICGGAYMVVDHSVWIPEMMRFARAGYVVASIEYRTSSEAQFPAQLIDVKSAIRYLKAHAEEYCIDPDRICVMGESAGGSLACLLGTTGDQRGYDQGDHLQFDSRVHAVVEFYGIADVEQNPRISGGAVPYWAMEAYLGSQNFEKQAHLASAIEYVTPDTPPFMILHGTDDPLIPTTQSENMYELLQSNGVYAEYLLLEGATHGDDLFYQDEIIERILSFLQHVFCSDIA